MANIYERMLEAQAKRKGLSGIDELLQRGVFAKGSYAPSILGRGGPAGLREQLLSTFYPEFTRARSSRTPVEDAFTAQASTPGALYGAASAAAQGYAEELFAPGGQIASLIRGARGKSIEQGFAPESAEGAELGILRFGTQAVGQRFAQEAAGLESARFGGLAQLYGLKEQSVRDLMESLFTGTATAEQLALAKRSQKRFLGIF